MTELKPCPFCGGKDIQYFGYSMELICQDCLSRGPANYSERVSNKKWNERK